MASIRIKTGTEGPSWDPYGYTRITFTRSDGVKVIHHSGLGECCEVDCDGMNTLFQEEEASSAFYSYTGLTPVQAERIYYKSRSRCSDCGGKKGRWVKGHPGEYLKLCVKCDGFMASEFCEREVI